MWSDPGDAEWSAFAGKHASLEPMAAWRLLARSFSTGFMLKVQKQILVTTII